MIAWSQPKTMDPKRPVLAAVLAVIGLALLAGGIYLLTLGGSAYYLLAGLAVCASAYLVARGDRRGIWIYLALLLATLIWALWERGSAPWALQSRLVGPVVLGLWVAAPLVRQVGRMWLLVSAAAAAGGLALLFHSATRNEPLPAPRPAVASGTGEWHHYGNSLAGTRFSPVAQIDAGNVARLEHAWTYRTGVTAGMGFEATPLMIGDTLYLCSQTNVIVALDPETGVQRFQYDPKITMPPAPACRGVAYYRVPDAQGACAERVFTATSDARLVAIDARSGQPCDGFGNAGVVDLTRGMGLVESGHYYVTSAPTIVNGVIVLGGWVLDNQSVGEPSGVVRGFDAATGALVWAWDVDQPDLKGEPAEGHTYSRGTINSWGPMSGDEALGMVYLPTGNATPDYWGGHRSKGSETFGSSVVALDSRTGALRWHFQTVHHDLWDYDVAGQPTLIDLPIGGKTVPALLAPTKQGQIYLLDRRTGKPLAEVQEKPVPQGAAPGDWTSKTQPFAVGMPAFDNTVLSEQRMWGATPLDQLLCRIKFRQARYEGPYTPPGLTPSIFYPGFLGGIDWGGIAVDPERHLMTVNWNRVPNYIRMMERTSSSGIKKDAAKAVHVGLPAPMAGTPFAVLSGAFLSPLEMPCTEPPFGKIGVVDLVTRKLIWDRALGTAKDSGPAGLASHLPLPMGVPNTGGSMMTRAGLIFVGATQEKTIRAYDSLSGKRLWSAPLPAGGHATPMTYTSPKSGRQFVVIAAGGNMTLHSGAGDYVVAFALPTAKP